MGTGESAGATAPTLATLALDIGGAKTAAGLVGLLAGAAGLLRGALLGRPDGDGAAPVGAVPVDAPRRLDPALPGASR